MRKVENKMKLCDKIAKLRKIKGLSQEELAEELDVSRQSVFKWESGENTPDLEKIKKLAKLFNVTFDTLLDDEKDLDDIYQNEKKEEIKENSSNQTIKYRKVYDSKIKLNAGEQADYEHGYSEFDRKADDNLFAARKIKHEKTMADKGYTKTIRPQHDLLVDFFTDDKNMTFGFFFDGAPQFVCPFENFVSFSVANDGPTTAYSKSTVVGVGIGKRPSIGVGSVPVSSIRAPLIYDCTLTYFDENGSLCVYKIKFGCNRTYIIHKKIIKTQNDFRLWEDSLSKMTGMKLNEISSYLEGIKEVGNQIKNGQISVKQVDYAGLKNEIDAGQYKKETLSYAHKTTTGKNNKGAIIALIIVGIVVVAGIATCATNNTQKQNQIVEKNKTEAQNVIDLIDKVTSNLNLSSGSDIETAENAYNRLTSDQQRLVTNYDKLASAREELEKMKNDELNKETKDDPTRTIVIEDLNGKWKSENISWAIANINDGVGILYWTTGSGSFFVTGKQSFPSSYLVGYNNKTRKMEIKLYHFMMVSYEWLDISMTKSETNELTLYYNDLVFSKLTAK